MKRGADTQKKKRRWGVKGETRTKPACNPPPSHIYSFFPSVRNRKRDHTGNIHSFRKQFYVTYRWKTKTGGGADRQIPKIQRFTVSFPTAIPFSASCSSLPPSPLPPAPSVAMTPAFSRRSATSDRSENCRGAGLRDVGGRGVSAGGGRSWGLVEPSRSALVGPPVVAVVRRLVHLRLLLNGSVLAPLSGAALAREGDPINQTEAFY